MIFLSLSVYIPDHQELILTIMNIGTLLCYSTLRKRSYAIFALVLPLLTACTSNPAIVTSAESPSAQPDYTPASIPVYVASHGWHTGVILPAAPLNQQFPQLRERFGAPPFYEVGWGDAKFYPADEVTSGLTLHAALFSRGAVIQVVAVPKDPLRYFANSQVRPLCLTPAQRDNLQQFIINSLQIDDKGQLLPREKGLYGNSQFYAANGHFHLLHTCNTWTSKALRSAGFSLSPMTLRADGLMDALPLAISHCP